VPPQPPTIVYLDLNHWIAFAKANSGHSSGAAVRDVLEACDTATGNGAAIFPISDTIYFEVNKIGTYRQRRSLRDVIERISRFVVVTSRSVVSVHEIETMLDTHVGPSRDPINPMDYIDWGVIRAFGMRGDLRVFDSETAEDVTEQARAGYPEGAAEFDRIMWEAQLELNRKVLDGPTPGQQEAEMRASGWNPRSAFEVAERRARQELEQVARFDANPSWRRGRTRDVVAAREIIIELSRHFWKGLKDRGVEFGEIFSDPEATRAYWDAMPSFDVAVTLKTEYHRDSNHVWRTNDIADIDALGSTLPYCDVVVTDKAVASLAIRSGLAERLGTVVLSRTADLAKYL
jgi:hypothetical protein